MANRLKEDEKNERIIRGLLKLPANRKCINCNSLGPQYVCTTFSIFICTNCSGIHREFTHRVKSVSMAKFTSQEVTSLQEGGNECAKEIFFKEWDSQRHSFPDSCNVERLRTFIKHVYVDRRYTGEKPIDKPPRVKGDRDEYEQRKPDTFRRSPPYDDGYDRRYNDRPGAGGRNDDRNFRYNYDERRSPGYNHGDYRRSPGQFDAVDDRRRDDKSGNVGQNQRFEDRRFPDGVQKTEGSSPIHQKSANSPVVRPVRDILGDDAPALQVGELRKTNGAPVIEGPPPPAQTVSASSSSSAVAISSEPKSPKPVSLIDFEADLEPSVAAASKQPVPAQTSGQASEANWASFDSMTVPNPPQSAANMNALESVFAQLSESGSASTSNIPFASGIGTDPSQMTLTGQLPNVHLKEPSIASPTRSEPIINPIASSLVGGASDQLKTPSLAPNVPVSQTAFSGHGNHDFHVPSMESNAVMSSLQNAEARASGRKELPVDLFASAFPTGQHPTMSWHAHPNYGMGYSMQYPQQAVPSFSNMSKSANPFDVTSEPTLSHASTFPSLAPLQGVLPNPVNSQFSQMLPQNQQPVSVISGPGGYMGQQFQNIPVQQFPSDFSAQQFQSSITQQTPNNMFPPQIHGIGNVPSQAGVFPLAAGMNMGFSHPGIPNAFRPPAGRNPFG